MIFPFKLPSPGPGDQNLREAADCQRVRGRQSNSQPADSRQTGARPRHQAPRQGQRTAAGPEGRQVVWRTYHQHHRKNSHTNIGLSTFLPSFLPSFSGSVHSTRVLKLEPHSKFSSVHTVLLLHYYTQTFTEHPFKSSCFLLFSSLFLLIQIKSRTLLICMKAWLFDSVDKMFA